MKATETEPITFFHPRPIAGAKQRGGIGSDRRREFHIITVVSDKYSNLMEIPHKVYVALPQPVRRPHLEALIRTGLVQRFPLTPNPIPPTRATFPKTWHTSR